MLRIKLVKTGKKNRPTWRVIVVEKTKTGKGKVAEYLGSYNPHLNPKELKINKERYDYWIGVGAQPTDTVIRLKGKYIDKNKEYQKLVKAKIYKKKKEEEIAKKEEKPKEKIKEKQEPITSSEEVKKEEVKEETKETKE